MTALSAWRRTTVPSDILPLITAVFIGGSIAGFLAATPLLFVTTPLVAVCLAAAAAAGARKPEWNGMAGATLASLPAGRARELLVDLLRRAATVPAGEESACWGPRMAASGFSFSCNTSASLRLGAKTQ